MRRPPRLDHLCFKPPESLEPAEAADVVSATVKQGAANVDVFRRSEAGRSLLNESNAYSNLGAGCAIAFAGVVDLLETGQLSWAPFSDREAAGAVFAREDAPRVPDALTGKLSRSAMTEVVGAFDFQLPAATLSTDRVARNQIDFLLAIPADTIRSLMRVGDMHLQRGARNCVQAETIATAWSHATGTPNRGAEFTAKRFIDFVRSVALRDLRLFYPRAEPAFLSDYVDQINKECNLGRGRRFRLTRKVHCSLFLRTVRQAQKSSRVKIAIDMARVCMAEQIKAYVGMQS